MKLSISKAEKTLYGKIKLPSSKSISNRVLIINALCNSPYDIANLSDSDDTRVMQEVLKFNQNNFDIGHAGTAMRFLTAYLSREAGDWILTGSERMRQRPVGVLVDALRKLGASIEYTGTEGYPPLHIIGKALKGGSIELDGSVSSQYISALLLIAPTIQKGLTIKLLNEVTSRPYIWLTLKLMEQFGIYFTWEGDEIRINEQAYRPIQFTVEADWSGASYWYEMAALADDCNLLLKGLQLKSLQGDASQADWFRKYFGVHSNQESEGVRLTKIDSLKIDHLTLNFVENPDLAQTFVVLCVCKGLPFHFKGLHTLKIKETDRISALQNEIAKFGAILTEPALGELTWDGSINHSLMKNPPLINTYHDHRMALAFAPAAISLTEIIIDDPMVITKSYPSFYEDLNKTGFRTREI
jgi:3-phosphoshikimate 1-carboxyvinyltransferase